MFLNVKIKLLKNVTQILRILFALRPNDCSLTLFLNRFPEMNSIKFSLKLRFTRSTFSLFLPVA